MIAFTAVLSQIAALLSELAPAAEASKADVLSGPRHDALHVGRLRLHHALVIGPVPFSGVIVIAAGLFMRALHQPRRPIPVSRRSSSS